jgi:hypothetical protein
MSPLAEGGGQKPSAGTHGGGRGYGERRTCRNSPSWAFDET